MARMAIVREDGTVANVIVAEPEWAATFAREHGMLAREVVTELETPATGEAVVSRTCAPGSRLVVRKATKEERKAGRARKRGRRHVVEEFLPKGAESK